MVVGKIWLKDSQQDSQVILVMMVISLHSRRTLTESGEGIGDRVLGTIIFVPPLTFHMYLLICITYLHGLGWGGGMGSGVERDIFC